MVPTILPTNFANGNSLNGGFNNLGRKNQE